MSARLRYAAIAALMIPLLGCSECRKDGDCPEGEACVNGECMPSSGSDADADAGDAVDGIDVDAADDTGIDPDGLDPPVDDGAGDVPTDGEEEDTPCTSDGECDDSNPCTDDACNMSFHMCENVPADGRDCDDGDPCNGVGVCDETGTCVTESSPLCDDFNDCTFDTCVTGGTDCTHDPAPLEGSACDNDLFCDGSDACESGTCMAADPSHNACDDGDLCTFDLCTEGSGAPVCDSSSTVTPRALPCGATVSGVTSGASGASTYGTCSGTLGSGPEEMIAFAHTADTDVTFTLVADPVPTADNNELYVLTDGCDPSTCTQVGGTSVTVTGVTAGTRVYISVESISGGAYFAVQASCS